MLLILTLLNLSLLKQTLPLRRFHVVNAGWRSNKPKMAARLLLPSPLQRM
ncbi:hypothetical protein NHF46_05605 [Arthrobacter alpinus]|nr:hypothetical protein [Arthrobacter alpinus]